MLVNLHEREIFDQIIIKLGYYFVYKFTKLGKIALRNGYFVVSRFKVRIFAT